MPRACLLALLLLAGCTDEDGDGYWAETNDCDDFTATTWPGAPEVWNDGVDNDCDGVVDSSDSYLYFAEAEPNDVILADCFAPSGQELGELAGFGLLNRLSGRIDDIEDESYDEGDLDCYQLRFPEGIERSRMEIWLSWEDPDSDLDFAVQGLWEGEQQGFALADLPGPGPEVALTSSGFDAGSPLWVWIVGYAGPPTNYTLDLVLR